MQKTALHLLLLATLAAPAAALAEASPVGSGLTGLPELPRASELTDQDIGGHFTLTQGNQKESVFFAGVGPEGRSIAFSLTDVAQYRATFKDATAYCAAKGQGWRMPTVNEMRMATPFADAPDPDYLPGSYWTTTLAPCFDCPYPDLFKIAYDVRTGNVRNNYDSPIFKNYTLCAYDIP